MKYNDIKKENIYAMALVDKNTNTVERVSTHSHLYIAQFAAFNGLLEHKDDKERLYRAYVMDNDMYCIHSYCFYEDEVISLPGGFIEDSLSENIIQFLYDKVMDELRSKLFND